MVQVPRWRSPWILCFAVIVLLGLLSRLVHTGWVLFDKYLGDGLYAAMVYALLRLWWPSRVAAVMAAAVMAAIESFQLTLIPAQMLTSAYLAVRLLARLLGTQFSYLDLLAYAVAIGCMYFADSWQQGKPR